MMTRMHYFETNIEFGDLTARWMTYAENLEQASEMANKEIKANFEGIELKILRTRPLITGKHNNHIAHTEELAPPLHKTLCNHFM